MLCLLVAFQMYLENSGEFDACVPYCRAKGPFRHTEMDDGKALILLAYVCYKRLLQKESRSRAPTTDEVKDAHRVCTRVHGRPAAPPPAGRPHHRRLHADFPR